MLNIGPAGFRDAGQVETVARGDEGALGLTQRIARIGPRRIQPLIGPARALRLLHCPHDRGEHELGEAVGHGMALAKVRHTGAATSPRSVIEYNQPN